MMDRLVKYLRARPTFAALMTATAIGALSLHILGVLGIVR